MLKETTLGAETGSCSRRMVSRRWKWTTKLTKKKIPKVPISPTMNYLKRTGLLKTAITIVH